MSRRGLGVFLHDEVDVGPTVSKGVERRSAGCFRAPFQHFGVDVEWGVGKIDVGIQLTEVEQAGDTAVAEGQEDFDQTDHPGGGSGVADMSLGTANGAIMLLLRKLIEGAHEGVGLDGIAQLGAGPMGLDIGDVLGIDAVAPVDTGHQAFLGLTVRSGDAVAGTVLIHP